MADASGGQAVRRLSPLPPRGGLRPSFDPSLSLGTRSADVRMIGVALVSNQTTAAGVAPGRLSHFLKLNPEARHGRRRGAFVPGLALRMPLRLPSREAATL